MTKLEDAANLSKQGKLNEAIELYKNILKDGKGI
jgi:pentatricopeptide repeat protein